MQAKYYRISMEYSVKEEIKEERKNHTTLIYIYLFARRHIHEVKRYIFCFNDFGKLEKEKHND